MTSFVDLNDLNEKDLHLWRYHQKSILSFKYSTMHLYQHVYLRPNKNLLKLVNIITLTNNYILLLLIISWKKMILIQTLSVQDHRAF